MRGPTTLFQLLVSYNKRNDQISFLENLAITIGCILLHSVSVYGVYYVIQYVDLGLVFSYSSCTVHSEEKPMQ